jgi:Cu-processing system ATP-binding protein
VTTTVELKGVSKRYGKIQAVRDVSLDLASGETIALVGHNGAGKTTLLKLMLGLAHPTAGTIRVLGDDPAAGEFAARSKVGYLPENVSFNTALTGREILTFYARLKREPVAKALRLLDRVELGSASARRVATYSKGMRQRLGLAQALIGEPRLLLLDEPTTGLDPALRISFYKIMHALRGQGATVVLSSHALAELGERADRVAIMNHGTLVAHGSIEELRRIARLPTRIRLTLSEKSESIRNWLDSGEKWHRVNGEVVEIEIAPERKIELLRRATVTGAPVKDVDVMQPTLDEIYAYFLRIQEWHDEKHSTDCR